MLYPGLSPATTILARSGSALRRTSALVLFLHYALVAQWRVTALVVSHVVEAVI